MALFLAVWDKIHENTFTVKRGKSNEKQLEENSGPERPRSSKDLDVGRYAGEERAELSSIDEVVV